MGRTTFRPRRLARRRTGTTAKRHWTRRACLPSSIGPPFRPSWTRCGSAKKCTPTRATPSLPPAVGCRWSRWRDDPADRAGRANHLARHVRGPSTADRLLLHVAHRPPRGRAVRRLHLGHHPSHGAVLPAFPRHHLRRLLQGAYDESIRYHDFMGWEMPCYSAEDSLGTLLVGRQIGRMHLVCYQRNGDRVFETYWTTIRGVETMDYSYALMDLTVYGRQEAWEDSPAGWPRRGHLTRTDGGAPDWPRVSGWPGGGL